MSGSSAVRTARPVTVGRPSGPRRPRLAVVPERIARRSRVPFLGLVALVLLLGVSGLLLFNTWMQQSAFTATRLEDRAHRLEAREQSLQMSLAREGDPQRLAARARDLGLVPAVHPAFLRLEDGKVLGDPVPAAPGDAMRINPRGAVKPKALAPAPRVVKVPAEQSEQTQQGRVQQEVQQNGHGG